MIAGVTPFRGATAQAMMVRQISGDPPSVCAERERCPRAVDDVLKRGLAKSPADRYQHAGEFAGALRQAVQGAHPVGGPEDGAPREPRRRRLMSAGVLGLAIVLGGWLAARNAGAGPALDRNVYAVFPLREDSTAPRTGIDGAEAARLLNRAMARWSGIRMVNNMLVTDLWARRRPRTVEEGLKAAESLSAGALAWGDVVPLGDSLEIHVVAYDVSGGAGASREFTMYLSRDPRDWRQTDSVFAVLADSILVGGRAPRGMSVTGTHNLQAFGEFQHGFEALDRFDLRAAQIHFDAATQDDENFALAHLWAARVRAWRGEADPSTWLGDAMRAVRLSDSLSSSDKVHARALLDLAEGHPETACTRYLHMTSADSTDFAAWLGLGDCNARDNAVVPDTRSPTGRAFRGSFNTAVRAYRRALALVPSFQQAERGSVFGRLTRRVLFTEESTLRRGVGVAPDTQRYVAFPSFEADTLAFTPVPYHLALRSDIRPPTEHRAVMWAAATMRELMRDWVTAFPSSPDAQAAYSLALETSNALEGSSSDLSQALQLARRAAARTDSSDSRLYREVAVVRLLLKSDSLAAARILAESLLAANPSPPPYQAGYLANLAALTGRARRAAALLRIASADSTHIPFLGSDGRFLTLPGDLMPTVLALRAFSSLDAPHDSVLSAYRRIDGMLQRNIPVATRLVTRQKILATPAILASEDLGVSELVKAPTTDALLQMRAAVAIGDNAAARAASARFDALIGSYSPGTLGIDRMTAYATMLLALGDTSGATRQLDAGLAVLPRARTILLETTPPAAALGRAFLLRAQLAVSAADTPTARRRLGQAEALWSHADPELKTELDALRHRL
jgi:tetratricopeptide (TPR) repeat protein